MKRLCVVSGKGGTGKTTVSASLTVLLSRSHSLVAYDMDVEEPNLPLLLRAKKVEEESVRTFLPKLKENECDWCGECAKRCKPAAIVVLPGKWRVFPDLCTSCGVCKVVCPRSAIVHGERLVGTVSRWRTEWGVRLVVGALSIGVPSAVPLLRRMREMSEKEEAEVVLCDGPPGTSCNFVETVRGCDLALVVVDPSPFGVHDGRRVVEACKELRVPCAVVLNRLTPADEERAEEVKKEWGVEVLGEVKYVEEWARSGEPLASDLYLRQFQPLAERLEEWLK